MDAAVGFLTGVWDQLGVVLPGGRAGDPPTNHQLQHHASPLAAAPIVATSLAFPWSLFDTNASDVDYGLLVSAMPYVPTARGCSWGVVLALLGASGSPHGWAWQSADPRGTGVYTLTPAPSDAETAFQATPSQPLCGSSANPQRALAVWQDRVAWSSLAGSSNFTMTGVPPGAQSVDVYAWDGWRSTTSVPPDAGGHVLIAGLPGNETYMFFAHEGGEAQCARWACGWLLTPS